MQYALLVYNPVEDTDRATRPIPGTLAALFDQPNIAAAGAACTPTSRRRRCATTGSCC